MRFLFTTQPGFGHLHPVVPIARALASAGHEVAVATSRRFREEVESRGLACLPAGLDWHESEAERAFPELAEVSLDQRGSWLLTEAFAGAAGERMVPELLDLCADWRPDAIVRTQFEFAGCIVGERLGIPYAALGIDFFFPVHWWKTQLGPRLAYLRGLAGLPPHPAFEMLYQQLFLSLVPPSYQFPTTRLASVVHSIRPQIADGANGEGLPDWLEQLTARPLILATLGTVFNRTAEVFRWVVEALASEPVHLVVTTGRSFDPAELGPLPDNARAVRYIPQTLLLPHCALVINHGGFSTLMSTFARGLPVLVIPLGLPMHGLRCVGLGVGLTLRPPQCFDVVYSGGVPELSRETIRDSVRQLLGNPTYGRNARRLQREMLALPGPEQAAELLIGLAAATGPGHGGRPPAQAPALEAPIRRRAG